MPDARYQGAYAEQYVSALALACDVNVSCWTIDDHGVDLTLCPAGKDHPKVDVQVKSWSTPRGSEEHWHFDRLNEVQYNHLVPEDDQPERVLVVLIVPKDRAARTELMTDGLLLRHHAYFTGVPGPRIEIPDPRRRRQVLVPKRNVLTPAALRSLVVPHLVHQRSGS